MKEFDRLLKTVRTLRSPKGCPWDRVQKVKDMKNYLLEEVYELIDEIDKNDPKAVKEELGDIFLILMVISEMFREKKEFDLEKVFININNKLISRHPHVFGSRKLKNKEEVLKHWIQDKAKQKKRKSIKDRLPRTVPSLLLANIFLKERAHIEGQESNRDYKKILVDLGNKAKQLKKNKPSKELLIDMIIDISKIAFKRGISLEGQMRKTILRQAKQASYRR